MAGMLIDTNVLIHAYDRGAPEKQQRALAVLDALARSGDGRLSAPVLSEFFVHVTREMAAPLTVEEAHQRVQRYAQIWPVVPLTAQVVLEAIRGAREHQFSFWDAQIWAAARLGQVPVVLSEDFDAGAVIEGVRFVDPFADDFRIGQST